MVKDYKERPSAAELLKHPFIHDELDYETAKQDYMDYKDGVLRKLGKISDDYAGEEFGTLDNTVDKRGRSKTVKEVS